MSIRSAVFGFSWWSKPTTDKGADGPPSNSTLLREFMSAAENQAEMRAWRERVASQIRAELHKQPGRLGAPGAAHAVIHSMCTHRPRVCSMSSRAPWSRRHAHARALTIWQGTGVPETASADDAESKVALVLEHGLRPDRRAAEAFMAGPRLQRLTLAECQQRIEALRMYGRPLAGVPLRWFLSGLNTVMLPRLAFIDSHACAPTSFSSRYTVVMLDIVQLDIVRPA